MVWITLGRGDDKPRKKHHYARKHVDVPRGGYISGVDCVVYQIIDEINSLFGSHHECPYDVMQNGTPEQRAYYCALLGISPDE